MSDAVESKNPIDSLFKECFDVARVVPFVEYYSHDECDCWKILNVFTKYKQDKIVLCKMSDGIELALTRAIKVISERKNISID